MIGFEFASAAAELSCLLLSCVVLVIDLFLPAKNKIITYLCAQGTVLTVIAVLLMNYSATTSITFSGHFIVDPLATVSKICLLSIAFLAFIFSRVALHHQPMPQGEYYLLALFALLGMMVMISANHFLTLFLGIELASFPLYAMAALRKDSAASSEAAFKFLITGAIASAMLLYGLSLLYGATGQLTLAAVMSQLTPSHLLVQVGMVFTVIALLFKLGLVPFHMWVPDVYHGTPASIVALISSAPKIAAFVVLYRLLVHAMMPLYLEWQQLLIIVAVLSMFFGNLLAIAQTNIKRMFAYSSIAHMGYLLLGIIAATPQGYAAAWVYAIVYAIMAVGGFAVIVLLSQIGLEAEAIDDFRGLNARNPWIAFLFLIILFSMAGIPPIAGFFAKLGVIAALVDQGIIWLAVLAVVFSIIGAF